MRDAVTLNEIVANDGRYPAKGAGEYVNQLRLRMRCPDIGDPFDAAGKRLDIHGPIGSPRYSGSISPYRRPPVSKYTIFSNLRSDSRQTWNV